MVATFVFFFFNDTATTEIYTLSLHDALPICLRENAVTEIEDVPRAAAGTLEDVLHALADVDRESTRLNSSHSEISDAVFCFKKNITRGACDPVVDAPHDAHECSPCRHQLSDR